jgi:hypothetical protein
MSQDLHDPFRDLRAPAAPAGLRRRALDAARAAAAEPARAGRAAAATLTDRLWESRPLRLASGLAVAALLGINLWLDSPGPGSGARPARSAPRIDGHGELFARLESRDAVLDALFGAPAEPGAAAPSTRPRRLS